MNEDSKKPSKAVSAPPKKAKKINLPLVVYLSFALILATVCFIIFLVNIDYALSLSGDYIPDFFLLIYYYFIVCLGAAAAAVVVKLILDKKIRIGILLLCALLLPWIQYYTNFQLFTGPLAFIPKGDFNLDGVNDELYEKINEYREVTSVSYPEKGSATSAPFVKVEAVAYGRGATFDSAKIHLFEKYHSSNKFGYMSYWADLGTNEITGIDIYVTLNHPDQDSFTKFYIVANEGWDNEEYIRPKRELLEDGRIKLSLSEFDIEYYKSITQDSDIRIMWKYNIV